MNKEYSLIYEGYLNQSGMAVDQQNTPYRRNHVKTKTDAKNSYGGALRTSDLPAAGSGKSGPIGGGITIDNEEEMVHIKGYPPMKRAQAEMISLKLIDEILNLTKRKSFTLVPGKIELLQSIIDKLQ